MRRAVLGDADEGGNGRSGGDECLHRFDAHGRVLRVDTEEVQPEPAEELRCHRMRRLNERPEHRTCA